VQRITLLSAVFIVVGLTLPTLAEVVPPGTDAEIQLRLAPFGSLCRKGEACGQEADTVSTGPQSGEDVYNQFCFACHATGASEAPLFADAEAWQPRLAKGLPTLMSNTLDGLGLMPPRGTCMNCSEDELRLAVDFMLDPVR
jgi:cytochrome c5